MIEIKQGESGVFDFGLEIFGDASGQPELRMVIAHPSGHLLSFPTQRFENGSGYRVSLPSLEGLLPPGTHEFSLEVFLGDRFFRPLEDTLRIIEPVGVAATVNNVTPITREPTIVATMAPARPPPPPVKEAAKPWPSRPVEAVKPAPVKVAPVAQVEIVAPVIDEPIIEVAAPAAPVVEAVKPAAPKKPAKPEPVVKRVSDADLNMFGDLLRKK
jgi:hypothetical protein